MKKIGTILLLTAIIIQASSQEAKSKEKQEEKQRQDTSLYNPEITKVTIGKDLFSIEDGKEAVRVRIGNRALNILETLESGPKVFIERFDLNNDSDQEDRKDREVSRARFRRGFKGHWSGIEFGFNNYLTSDNSFIMPDEIYYMTLHSGKSQSFNINFTQQSFGFTRHIGIVTGLGINWNNYRFDGNNNIMKGANGIIEELDPGSQLEKSKLTTVYLHLPVMLEFQIPADNHHVNIGGGFIGAIKLGSHTKMVFEDGDKVKSNGDFSLNLLRYGATARVGYENWHIYATYYMTSLFKSGKGPGGFELHPFEIGFAFTFND